mmetsp:Transcript_15526/g.22520  ORF Transcript_15526/g.22520 Transcript_15526/m.22520 type:complete len:107 (+) Transcript_15526:131-451(+)
MTDLQNMVRQADTNGSGRLDFTDFVRLYSEKKEEPISKDEVCKYFSMFDRNRDGKIDSSEFKKVMTTMGEALTDEEVEFIISEADKDGNGYIDYEEFSDILLKRVS